MSEELQGNQKLQTPPRAGGDGATFSWRYPCGLAFEPWGQWQSRRARAGLTTCISLSTGGQSWAGMHFDTCKALVSSPAQWARGCSARRLGHGLASAHRSLLGPPSGSHGRVTAQDAQHPSERLSHVRWADGSQGPPFWSQPCHLQVRELREVSCDKVPGAAPPDAWFLSDEQEASMSDTAGGHLPEPLP